MNFSILGPNSKEYLPRVTYEEWIEEMGRKVSKSAAELKRMAQDVEVFHRGPPTLFSN